jgi:threonine/homoserine/homoserine lactone efflux protein
VLARLVSFVGLAAVLTAVPGPAIVLIMKSAVLGGRRPAVRTALGVFCGDLVWVTASVAGLTAVLVASRPAFEMLRFAGAAYLVYLGLRLAFRRRDEGIVDHAVSADGRRQLGRRSFGQGVLCELSNPKTLIVFTSVIPPFQPAGSGPLDLAVLGLVFAVVGLGSCLAYALVLGRTQHLTRHSHPRLADGLLRGSGGILVGFGAGLAVEGARAA